MAHDTLRRGKAALRRGQQSETATVAVFVVLAVVAAVILAPSVGAAARRTGTEEASRSFRQLAAVVAGSVVAPLLTPQLVGGSASAEARLDLAVDRLETTAPVVTVAVRDGEGDVVWSDDPSATAVPLRPDQRTALQEGTLVLASTDGSARDELSASVGVQATGGTPLLVEVTGRRDDLAAPVAWSAWTAFAPVSLGAVLLLQLAQLPFLWRLARRVREHARTESALREAALAATGLERRRIAGEVHDDVLPGLHALVYELDAQRLARVHRDGDAAVLDRTAEGLRSGIRRLRALLLELSEQRVPEEGLEAALARAADRMAATGVEVSVQADDLDRLPGPVAEVLYRCAQESLRNVAAHSGAERVDIAVAVDAAEATMTVDDDGRGFEGSRLAERRAAGHLGLQALGDLVADQGGSLTASSSPGQGTRIVARVPLDDVRVDMGVQR
ncbi:sensor histidine kinase [Modestobacter sp. I12A-02662]|uniref:sensor histidine kinase n=1 Tax=Modestobacter sp. I12A-02662 TaxID=1730496 RepID=UPI0034E0052A